MRFKRYGWILLPWLLAGCGPARQPGTASTSELTPVPTEAFEYREHRGNYFNIEYPAKFRVLGEGDSAFFTAPDNSAEFFVYSPQWGGEPEEIEPDLNSEVVSEKREPPSDEGVIERQLKIDARDKTYTRVVEDHGKVDSDRTTFGFKFQDARAQARYQGAYEHFKASLTKFADGANEDPEEEDQ